MWQTAPLSSSLYYTNRTQRKQDYIFSQPTLQVNKLWNFQDVSSKGEGLALLQHPPPTPPPLHPAALNVDPVAYILG